MSTTLFLCNQHIRLTSDSSNDVLMMKIMFIILCSRSQGKENEAEALLKDSIHYGPHFADAYSSLASLYAEQVKHPETSLENGCHFFCHVRKLKTMLELNNLCSDFSLNCTIFYGPKLLKRNIKLTKIKWKI